MKAQIKVNITYTLEYDDPKELALVRTAILANLRRAHKARWIPHINFEIVDEVMTDDPR